jgi:ferrochelatase
MKLVNCVALTRGDLQGKPSFSAFEEIKVSLNQVNRGDLFIAREPKEIEQAIKKGAYGIIYDFDYEPIDDEIAWIFVRCAKSSAIVIAKYLLLKKQLRFCATDAITFEVMQAINSDNSLAFLSPYDLPALFNAIKNDEKTIYVSSDDGYLQELTSENVESYFVPRESGYEVLSQTMFETVLLIGDSEMSVRLPSFMLRFLRNAEIIFGNLGLLFDLNKIKSCSYFEPVFVDDTLKEREFGRTSKVVIFAKFESNPFLRESIDFVKQKGRWGRTVFLMPSSMIGFEYDETIITYYGSDEELLDIISDNDFNFAFLLSAGRKIISKEKKEQLSLF